MQTKVEELGDRLVVPIPPAMAASAGIHKDSWVEVEVENGRLLASPVRGDARQPDAETGWEAILQLADEVPPEDATPLPADASVNIKHYLYGAPRRQ